MRTEPRTLKCGHPVYHYELTKSDDIGFITWECEEGCQSEPTFVDEAPFPDELPLEDGEEISPAELKKILKTQPRTLKCGHASYDYELIKSDGIMLIRFTCEEGCRTKWGIIGEVPEPSECEIGYLALEEE